MYCDARQPKVMATWAERFDQNIEAALALAGPERTRTWRMYLRVSRCMFELDYAAVYQFVARRPGWLG